MGMTVWDARQPSTARAREVAAFLLGESQARRLDPISTIDAEFDTVRLDVAPADMSVWRTWCNLLQIDSVWLDGRAWDDDSASVVGQGTWDGVRVVLTGLDAHKWAQS